MKAPGRPTARGYLAGITFAAAVIWIRSGSSNTA
jgi:hypothetical protein